MAGRGENGVEEESRRRLPIRAGDTDDLEVTGRRAEEGVRRGSRGFQEIIEAMR